MERLTKVINACGKTIIVYTQGKYEDTTAGEMEHEDIRNVMKRLSDYEDTGLTSPEIMELKERDTAKTPVELDGPWYKCPTCGKYAGGLKGNFCHVCGQRLKWED